MPNLPGSSVNLDASMFQEVLKDADLQVDQWKVYPCEITPWTLIKKW
jgi:histone acetyltransferase (RNA polymerase elongator complex component)